MEVEGEYHHILGYEAASPREEKKYARPESTHNPSGGLPDTTRWSRVEERMFYGLRVKVDKRDETCLAAFLSCWLCAFVLPNKEVEFIRPGTFNMASLMASGKKISLPISALIDVARPIPIVHLGGSGEVCNTKVLNTAPKRKTPTKTAYVSKRLLEGESESSSKEVYFRRLRVLDDAIPPMVESCDNAISTSRTITVSLNKENNVVIPQREESQDSGESISCSDLMKPPSMTQVEKGTHYISCEEVKDNYGYEARNHPPPSISVFDGKKVILDAQKDFISSLWNVIKGKLSRSDVDSASSLRDEIQVIIKEMDCKGVDVSPFEKLLNYFFDLAISYDQERLTLHDMDVESNRKELFVAAVERLTNAMFEEQDEVEEVSSLRHSLDIMKEIRALCKRAQDLQVLLTATKDEVEEANLATLFAT
ncbi:hypothetical protein KY285_036111 [Solanum tuberosum]|nr:hypothetical protein KY289_036274 [Solanum tuberosum]KAH0639525.1 hypothetical protein KY285_036111 [Solanum tuberosum]